MFKIRPKFRCIFIRLSAHLKKLVPFSQSCAISEQRKMGLWTLRNNGKFCEK